MESHHPSGKVFTETCEWRPKSSPSTRSCANPTLAVQFNLDLAQVHAALSYYFTHRTEIQAEIQENSEQAEKWRQVLSPKAS